MPNFEVGGIDVRAEPVFDGFAREVRTRLDEIEGQIGTFEVRAEPALVKDFKERLKALVEKAQSGFRFDIEASPILSKDFREKLRGLIAKAQSGVKFDIEASPALTKDFKAKLEALVSKAQAGAKFDIEGSPALTKDFKAKLEVLVNKATDGMRFDIEGTPALSKAFKKELQAQVDKAQAGVNFDVEVRPSLIKGFKTELRSLVDKGQAGVEMKIEARPSLRAGFKTELRDLVKAAAEFASTAVEFRPKLAPGFKSELRDKIAAEGAISVNAKLKFANKAQLRTQLREAINAAAEGLSVRVAVILDPHMTEFKAKVKESLRTTQFKAPIKADTSRLGNEMRAGFAKAKAGLKGLTDIPVRIKTFGASALKPITSTLEKIGGLAVGATKAIGLLSAGIVIAGAVGVKQSGEFQFQQLGLQAVLRSAEEGRKQFQGVLLLAKQTPFEVGDLAPTLKQLHGAGIATNELLPDLRALSDVTAELGRTGTNMAKVGIAFAKIQGKGKITAREFNSISENLPGFQAMAAIAKEMGITVPEAFDKMKTGAIPADVAIRGLVKGLKTFPGAQGFAAKAATETLQGALTNFPDLVRISFFQAFEKNLPQITHFLGSDGPLFKALNVVLKVVSATFVPVANAVLNLIAAITPSLGALVESVIPLVVGLSKGIGALAPGLTAIGKAVSFVVAPLAKVLPGLGREFGNLVATVVGANQGAFAALGTGIANFATGAFKALGLLTPLIGPILRLLGTVGTTLGRVLPVLASVLTPVLLAAAPVVKSLIGIIGDIFIALAPVAGAVAMVAIQVVKALLPAFKELASPAFVAALTSLVTTIGGVLVGIAGFVPPALKLVEFLARLLAIKGVLPAIIAGVLAYKVALVVLRIQSLFAAQAQITLAAAEAGTAVATEGLTVAQAGLALSMEALQIALGVGLFVLLAVAIYELYQKWKPFHNIVDATGRFLRDHMYPVLIVVGIALAALLLPLGGVLGLTGLVAAGVVALGVAAVSLYRGFAPVRAVVDAVGRAFERLLSIFFHLEIKPIIDIAKALGSLLTGDFSGFARHVGDAFASIFDGLKNLGSLIGGGLFDIGKFTEFLLSGLGKLTLTLLDTLGKLTIGLVAGLGRLIGSLLGSLGSTVIGWVVGLGGPVLRALSDFLSVIGQGVLDALGAIGEEFARLPGQVGRALVRFGPDVAQFLVRGLKDIPGAIGFALGAIVGLFILIPYRVGRALIHFGPIVAQHFRDAMRTAGRGVVGGLDSIRGFFARLPGQAVRALVRFGPDMTNAGLKGSAALGRGIRSGLTRAVRAFVDFLFSVGRTLGKWDAQLHRIALNALRALGRGASAGAGAVVRFFRDQPSRFVRAMGNLGRTLFGAGARMLTGLFNGVKSAAGAVVRYFQEAPRRFVSAMGGVGTIFHDVGQRIVHGMLNGIGSLGGLVTSAAKKLGSGFLHGLKSILGIGSPSKETQALAENAARSFSKRIEDRTDTAYNAGQAYGKSARDGMAKGLQANNPLAIPTTSLDLRGKKGRKEFDLIARAQAGARGDLGAARIPDAGAIEFARNARLPHKPGDVQAEDGSWVHPSFYKGRPGSPPVQPYSAPTGSDGFSQFRRRAFSGLTGNAFDGLQSVVGGQNRTTVLSRGIQEIAKQFSASGKLITASQAEVRDHLIREWVNINHGTNDQARDWIAKLNGTSEQLSADQKIKATTIKESWKSAWVQLHGGTVEEAAAWVADIKAKTDGHKLSMAEQARSVRLDWIGNWQKIHGGTLREADALYAETRGKTLAFNATENQRNAVFKDKWIAHWIDTRGGTVEQATRMFTRTQADALTWRTALRHNVEGVRTTFIDNWIKLHHGSVAQAVAAYDELRDKAAKGGTDIGTALYFGLASQQQKINRATDAWVDAIRGPLNSVLTGLGFGEIPARPIANAQGNRGLKLTRAMGGPIPGPAHIHHDSVPLWAVPGEYVLREQRVNEEGMHKLHALNRGDATIVYKRYIPKYATGGLVGAEPARAEMAPPAPRYDPTSYIQKLNIGGVVAGLNLEFLKRLNAWDTAEGNKYSIGSGYRSSAQQAVLYQRYINHVPGQAVAAPPGHSYHEKGLAVDLTPPTHNAHDAALAQQYGLYFPMSFEPWHIQPIGLTKGGASADASTPAGGIAAAAVQLPKPPHLTGVPWLDEMANAAMQVTYLKAQSYVNAHAAIVAAASSGLPQASLTGTPSGGLLGRVMAAIRQHESRGIYTARSSSSSASGAYQVLVGTWNGYAGFPDAASAPPAVQDRFAASRMGPVLAQFHDPGAVASLWFVGTPLRANDHTPVGGKGNTGSVADFADYVRALSAHIAGVPGYEQGGIIRHEDIVRVGERGKAEVIIPLTNPDRARQLADQSGLTQILTPSGKTINVGEVVVQITPPNAASPEAYGSSVAHRLTPALAAAIERALH